MFTFKTFTLPTTNSHYIKFTYKMKQQLKSNLELQTADNHCC